MGKIKQWIVLHKLTSILVSSVLVVGVSLAVALPLALAHKHTYSEDWSQDATYHWHACIGEDCNDTTDNSEHTFVMKRDDDNHWQECSVCGYKKDEEGHYLGIVAEEEESTHKLQCTVCDYITGDLPHSLNMYYDSTNHWEECDDCNYRGSDSVAHTFITKHNDTEHWEECACGYKKDKTTHSAFVANHDETNHWQECSCGYKKEVVAHTFTTNHNATNHWQECACGETKDSAAHSFAPNYDETKHWQECACGEKKDETAHDFETRELNTDTHKLGCKDCDYETALLSHNYEYWSDEDGHRQVCEVCYKENDPVAHTFVKKYNDTHYWQECSVCGYQKDKVLATVNATTFANALEFKDAEGNLYLNWQAELKNKGGNVVKIAKMTETAGYKYDTLYDKTNEFDALYQIIANIDGKSVAYKKYNETSVWAQTAQYKNSTWPASSLVSAPKSAFSIAWPDLDDFEFVYNKEDQMYHAMSENTSIKYCYDIKFENGKLVSCVYTVKGISGSATTIVAMYTWTISYGNATITLPEDSEIATLITYNSTENSYKSESVSLKANEAKTYFINITSELLDTYKGADGKCEIDGEFTTSSSATFTITAKDINGNVVVNLAAGDYDYDSNELVFKNLTAGKYFIEIKADADCTGAWDMKFADLTPVAGSSKETPIDIPFLSTDGKFVLNDVALSTADTWFVFEITEDYFDSNSEEGKCEILGEFTASDGATLTLTVENSSGTTIYNMSEDINEFHCEISTFGKYYIKVTSSAACTGAWDIAFADSTPAPAPIAGSTKATAIKIGWSSTDEKFVRNDVALSTTGKWFVLEITEATHSSYKKKSGKYELDGAFTLSGGSDATLTIVAQNESGTEIANNLNLTSLDAGKYYIKITADKDYTGVLSFEFKTGKISL